MIGRYINNTFIIIIIITDRVDVLHVDSTKCRPYIFLEHLIVQVILCNKRPTVTFLESSVNRICPNVDHNLHYFTTSKESNKGNQIVLVLAHHSHS